MNNILFIQGYQNGCMIMYTKNHQLYSMFSTNHPTKVIERIMMIYYRSIIGNEKMTKKQFVFHQKVPVFIDLNQFLFFPILSKKDKECCWINYYCVSDVKKKKEHTRVSFCDYSIIADKSSFLYEYECPVDVRVIRKQMKRCNQIHRCYVKNTNDLIDILESK